MRLGVFLRMSVRRDGRRSVHPWPTSSAVACRIAATAILCAAVLYAAGAAWVWPHSRGGFWASSVLEVVGPLLGGVLAIRRGRQLSGRARQTWVLLGCGACSYAAGMIDFDWYGVMRHTPAPFPGLSDVGSLLALVLRAAGVWRYPTLQRRRWSFLRSG